jgi:hypothetical protein
MTFADGIDNSIEVGASLAFTTITGVWNLDWRHYVRYWAGKSPNYGGRLVLALRVFVALSLIGSVLQLYRSVRSHSWDLQDVGFALMDAAALCVTFAAMDGIFRLAWGRPPKLRSGT